MHALALFSEGATDAGLGWMVWVVLLLFFIMVIIGWLASKNGWIQPEAEPVHAESHDHAETHADAQPAPQAEPSAADDLTKLEGIGPKVAQVLAKAGITTFAGLASAQENTLREALDAAGYKYMDPASWPEQAALAAKGDFEALKRLQDGLKGGRKDR